MAEHIVKLTLERDPSAIDPKAIDPVDQAAAIREVMFLVGGLVKVLAGCPYCEYFIHYTADEARSRSEWTARRFRVVRSNEIALEPEGIGRLLAELSAPPVR